MTLGYSQAKLQPSIMIYQAVGFLKDNLNQYINLKINGSNGLEEEKVNYLKLDKVDPLDFPINSITPVLINIQEEKILRAADQYLMTTADGVDFHVNPEIKIELYILFVSKFSAYEESLKYLSYIIKFFQSNRFFTHKNSPELSDEIEKLIVELQTMPFKELNEVWNSLRTTCLPSVLYKVKLLSYHDEDATLAVATTETEYKLNQ